MSINTLFYENGFILNCEEMRCKKIVPPTPGNPGDIYTVNTAGQSVFSKTFDGSNGTYQFKNCSLQVLNDDDSQPAILSAGTLSTNTQPVVIGMGELDTQNSFFFYYDPVTKDLGLQQNNACVDHDFTTNLNNGNLVLNNKLKLPTVTANNMLKLDNNNVVTNAINTDFNNFYNNDGTITDATRTINGNGADINIDSVSIFTNNSDRNIINATSRLEINTPTILLTQQTNGYLYSDNSGSVSPVAIVNNLISTIYNDTPGGANITVPANAKTAVINAVGGGGSGANIGSPNGLGGGGAGGALIGYTFGVAPGQNISVFVGAGANTPNSDGFSTAINLGTYTITCLGGARGNFANPTGSGGNGGGVVLPTGTISGGLGGNNTVGANGNIGFFAFSGAGGGSGNDGGTSYNGGGQLLFNGGASNSRQGGGGASAFADGGSYNVSGGSLGSGGPADVNGIFAGGNGFVQISFYS